MKEAVWFQEDSKQQGALGGVGRVPTLGGTPDEVPGSYFTIVIYQSSLEYVGLFDFHVLVIG